MAPGQPSPYRSRYLLYKKGSQQVVTWLYETASSLGSEKRLAELKTIDLRHFAQTISNASPKIELPAHIASILSDVIYLRQQAHEWYTSVACGDAAADSDRKAAIDASHHSFIDVLKREAWTSDSTNLFACLSLDEPSDSPIPPVAGPGISSTATDISAGKPEDERPFRIWCLLRDFLDIRVYVRQLWWQYYNGEITFSVAAYLTENSFRVVSDILIANPDKTLHAYPSILETFNVRIGHNKVGIANFSSTVDKDANGEEAADLFCAPAWCILSDLAISCQIDRGECPPRPEMTYFRHPFGAALRGLREQLKQLADVPDLPMDEGPLRLDLFTYNLLSICRYSYIDTAAVVQCQMYLDIYDALGRQTSAVMSMIQPTAASVSKSFHDYLHAVEGVPLFHKTVKEKGEHLLVLANVVLKDSFPSAAIPRACKPSALFAVLPILAGTYLYRLVRQTSSASIECASRSYGTFGAAYLYSAAKDKPTWANMDLLLEQHKQYVPHASSLVEYKRHLEQAFGAKKMTGRFGARNGLPKPVAGSRTPLEPTFLEQSIKLCEEKVEEKVRNGGKRDMFPLLLYEAIRFRNESIRARHGKRLAARLGSKSPIDLLAAFAKVIIDDDAKMSIDYFSLAIRCEELMALIAEKFRSRLEQLHIYVNRDGVTYQDIVHTILREGADAASKQNSTILDSLGPYFEELVSAEKGKKLTPKAFSGCIADEDKPCNRWDWGGDRPGYIRGKKVFGPETPDAFYERELREKSRPICKAAVERWESERDKGTTAALMEQKLFDIETWAIQEFVKSGLPLKLKRNESPVDIGFQPVHCEEAVALLKDPAPGFLKFMKRVIFTGST
ncbi:hypothetical protein CBER1_09112 [Cercospora berteroae]|uniref:DUF6604 domain-containing protein n=1 Tax=Cercospora berteroae TaxID=357750 RepID=A0A2S6CAJ1_9PEZI|nr:hypothetical protein CBER1_09112 [Cercospora berteroae]